MSSRDEILVYGAGMSGLIAAANLARVGYRVTVREGEKGFGGSSLYNPSTHVTPLDPAETSEYIGIDISGVFHPLALPIPFYFHDTPLRVPQSGFYAVERGDRSTSLDTLLYSLCIDLGVRFEFESPLTESLLADAPPRTIIACGLTESVYRMLDIPFVRWYGWISRGKARVSDYAWIWWDECISEYGYYSSVNDYYSNLLFSSRPVDRGCLRRYQEFMARTEGIEHEHWEYASGVVPVAGPDNPRLVSNGRILAGTMTGAMDPMFWFGISGALVTGKIAADAVSDPELARSEFARFTRAFRSIYSFKSRFWYPFARPRIAVVERFIKLAGSGRLDRRAERFVRLIRTGKARFELVPGFGPYNVS